MAAYTTRNSVAHAADENTRVDPKAAAGVKASLVGINARGIGTRSRVLSDSTNAVQNAANTRAGDKKEKIVPSKYLTSHSGIDVKRGATVKSNEISKADAAGLPGPGRAKPVARARASQTVAVGVTKKQPSTLTAANASAAAEKKSMTATLTECSEEACGGIDVMEGIEEPLPDIDFADRNNPLAATEYVEDIYGFYKKIENMSVVPFDYMTRQADINEKMRAILLDWLIEVHLKFKLMPETLYLTTNLIDRFLAVFPVSRKNLQLVGVTAMLVASKYEEIWPPEVKDFVYITDNAYTKDQILAMEKQMLNTLKFNLTVPTPYVFAARFLKAAGSLATDDKRVEMVTWFLIELSIPEYSMLQFSPSHIAAAAVYTAILTVKKTASWSSALCRHSHYSEESLLHCSGMMATFHKNAASANLNAVHKKYSHERFGNVVTISPAKLSVEGK